MSDPEDKKIPLVEIFGPTIQGEGAVIGLQTYFIRLGVCDYKCAMCDSKNAVDPEQIKANAEYLTQEQIVTKLVNLHAEGSTRWVTISGGNPCVHDLNTLVALLKQEGFKVAVETQGSIYKEWLHLCDVVTVSPKGPGMGHITNIQQLDVFLGSAYLDHISALNVKIVVFDQRDLEFAKELRMRYERYSLPMSLSLGNPNPPGLPLEGGHEALVSTLIDRYKLLFDDIKNDPILSSMRFLPQWHVFLWGNDKGK